MNLAPDVNSGNFFNQQNRRSMRYQAQELYSFSPPNFAGEHFMKIGGGVSYITFDGSNRSNTVRILREDGTRTSSSTSLATATEPNKTEFFTYFADKWSVNRRLTLEYGVRYDRDNVASENNFAPRRFAFLPIDGLRDSRWYRLFRPDQP